VNGWSHSHETLQCANEVKDREAQAIQKSWMSIPSHQPANAPWNLKERRGVHKNLEASAIIK
jgi:hypothetical protein